MFYKLVTPTKDAPKATLRDFLQITPERELSAVKLVSFEPEPSPPRDKSSVDEKKGSFLQNLEITLEKKPNSLSDSDSENHEHSHDGPQSCSGGCSHLHVHDHSTQSFAQEHLRPSKEPSKTFTALRKRYTDFSYVLKLVLKETGHGWRGKDCTCTDKQCKQKFERDSAAVQRIFDGLLANWGPTASKKDRRANLLQDLIVGYQYDASSKTFRQQWFLDGQPVCYNFYLAARGYSHNYVHKHRSLVNKHGGTARSIEDVVSMPKQNVSSPKKDEFIAWLQRYASSVGDYMPDEECVVLPYPKFEGVWLEYKQEKSNREEQNWLSYSYACRIFFEEISNIRLVRSKGSHVCCKVCTSYQMRILKAKTDHERTELKKLRMLHVEKQRQERLFYYANREKAIASPDKYLSIIIDGMDQSKTNIPLFSRKTSDRTWGNRLIGVKVHGIGNFIYVVDQHTPGGANLITEILRLTLLRLDAEGKLPYSDPTLYLQMDNCSENKNQVVFAFLTDLVARSIFDEIHVGFLMVGHTHEDIDQYFSIISSWLRKTEVICPDHLSLKKEIASAFTESKKNKTQAPVILDVNARQLFNYDLYYKQHINPSLC